jgi:transposase
VVDDVYRILDALWIRISELRSPRPSPPSGLPQPPRVDDRKNMAPSSFVLRTGCQWNALNGNGICSSNSAHRRFQESAEAGVFCELWRPCLVEYDGLEGIDGSW